MIKRFLQWININRILSTPCVGCGKGFDFTKMTFKQGYRCDDCIKSFIYKPEPALKEALLRFHPHLVEGKRGIIIGTSEHTKDFLRPCLESLKGTKYDILIVSNGGYNPSETIAGFLIESGLSADWCDLVINDWNGWELAVIQRGKENFDEFVHIMDSTLIKDISLFDKSFAIEGNVVYTKGNFHYMGKFVTRELPNLPRVHDKTTAIMLEVRWLDGFQYTDFEPDLKVHSDIWEEIHGQKRMRLENDFMIKWKGTAWLSPEQLADVSEEINKKYKA